MLVIATGGTIGKLPDWEARDASGASMFPDQSNVPDMFQALGIRNPYMFYDLMAGR